MAVFSVAKDTIATETSVGGKQSMGNRVWISSERRTNVPARYNPHYQGGLQHSVAHLDTLRGSLRTRVFLYQQSTVVYLAHNLHVCQREAKHGHFSPADLGSLHILLQGPGQLPTEATVYTHLGDTVLIKGFLKRPPLRAAIDDTKPDLFC